MLVLLRKYGEKLKPHFDGSLNDTVTMRCRGASCIAHVA